MAGVSGSDWVSFLKSIHLQNFKQFDSFIVSCSKSNILTGPNNAGKSTALDALRITADVLRYTQRRKPGRKSLADIGVCAYHQLPQSALSIPIENIAKNYSDDDASVIVKNDQGVTLYIYLHPEKAIDVFMEAGGALPTTGVKFRNLFDVDLCIVPTMGPFEETEKYLNDDYVDANRNTRRSARHFRNIVFRMPEAEFLDYQELVQETWPGVKLLRPELEGQSLTMMYEEGRIPREVHWSGFGLQMWFQMLLQIMRGGAESIFVLDEPDIYLHADIQRRLLKISQAKFGQLFLATHSTEIINEANPGDILMVRKDSRGAKRVTDEKSYRELFQYLGSSENAEFARVARAKRIIFFEGNDRKILKKLASKLNVGSVIEDTDTVFVKIGGFGQWQKVTHTKWSLSELFEMDVKIAALFDRDYRSTLEVDLFLENTDFSDICCKILRRKEIENYALSVPSLVRLISREAAKKSIELSDSDIEALLLSISDALFVDVMANISGQCVTFARKSKSKQSDTEIIRDETLILTERWKTLEGRFDIIPGKLFISQLSGYLQDKYKFSLTITKLVDAIRKEEIDPDLIQILSEFDQAILS